LQSILGILQLINRVEIKIFPKIVRQRAVRNRKLQVVSIRSDVCSLFLHFWNYESDTENDFFLLLVGSLNRTSSPQEVFCLFSNIEELYSSNFL
jgi:hypothetical protein